MSSSHPHVPPIVVELRTALQDQLVHKDDRSRVFLPAGSLRSILGVKELATLVEAFLSPASKNSAAYNTVDRLVTELRGPDDDPSRGLLRAVATLVYSQDPENIKKLIERALPLDQLKDALMPIEQAEAERLFGPPLGQLFGYNQFIFSALVFVEGNDMNCEGDQANCPLPYVDELEFIGHGASGNVSKIKIANGHWRTADGTMVNDSQKSIALKIFHKTCDNNRPNDAGNFESELEFLKKMKSERRYNRNIMYHLGSLVRHRGGIRNEYTIFFPLAERNLWEFLNSAYRGGQHAPETMPQKAELIRNACDLAGALAFLHDLGPSIAIYHWDIKPDNILLVREGDKVVWKLADFGFAHAKDLPYPSISSLSSSQHLQVNEPASSQNSSAPPTGGPGTYKAPEVDNSPMSKTGPESDIWSIGCVLAILYSYLDSGPRGVCEFGQKRSRGGDAAAPQADIDYFYATARHGNKEPFKTLYDGVTQWFSTLRERALERSKHTQNRHEDKCVNFALHYLEEDVLLVDRQKRKKTKASMLQRHLWQLRGFYSTGTEKVAPLRSPSNDLATDVATIDSAFNISQSDSIGHRSGSVSDVVVTLEPFADSSSFLPDRPGLDIQLIPPDRYDPERRYSSDHSPETPPRKGMLSKTTTGSSTGSTIASTSDSTSPSIVSTSTTCTSVCFEFKENFRKIHTDRRQVVKWLNHIITTSDEGSEILNSLCPGCGFAPLHQAVRCNSKILIEELFKYPNIKPNIKKEKGRTPFVLSIANEPKEHAIRALLKKREVIIDQAKFNEYQRKMTADIKKYIKDEIKKRE